MIEASYFNTSVINIGIRQKDRERGKNVIDLEKTSINSIYHLIDKYMKIKKISVPIYGDGKASKRIVKHLENITLSKQLIQKQISY